MNTRSSINKARMADIGELKALIETIRTDLGAKIDTLVKKLDEKDKKNSRARKQRVFVGREAGLQ